VFSNQRDFLGNLIALGDSAVAIGAVIGLWNYVDRGQLLAWSALIILTSCIWEVCSRKYADEAGFGTNWAGHPRSFGPHSLG